MAYSYLLWAAPMLPYWAPPELKLRRKYWDLITELTDDELKELDDYIKQFEL